MVYYLAEISRHYLLICRSLHSTLLFYVVVEQNRQYSRRYEFQTRMDEKNQHGQYDRHRVQINDACRQPVEYEIQKTQQCRHGDGDAHHHHREGTGFLRAWPVNLADLGAGFLEIIYDKIVSFRPTGVSLAHVVVPSRWVTSPAYHCSYSTP